MTVRRCIGVFGGTFDPVHRGHLTIALDFKQHLPLDELRLIPCHIPPHRGAPSASDTDRLTMLQLASADIPVVIDDRELKRSGPSYTVDTLLSLREEVGRDVSLVCCLGSDAFASLDRWHRWEELPRLAHIAIATRAAHTLTLSTALTQLLAKHQTEQIHDLTASPAGRIALVQLSQIPVSSTQVRQELALRHTAADIHPDVLHYIQQRGLYQTR